MLLVQIHRVEKLFAITHLQEHVRVEMAGLDIGFPPSHFFFPPFSASDLCPSPHKSYWSFFSLYSLNPCVHRMAWPPSSLWDLQLLQVVLRSGAVFFLGWGQLPVGPDL